MKTLFLTILTLSSITFVTSQNYEFGEVSLDEVKSHTYEKDTSASAVVLHKYRNTYFEYAPSDGWIIVTDVHERIKILNKDGLDFATKEILLYKKGKSKERVTQIKGYTFNEAGGKLNKEKLKRSAIFDTEVSDNWEKESFTMPDVKVGSVVEWIYKISSPYFKIDDLIIQDDIPIKHYHAKIQTLSYFNFKRIAKGNFNVQPKEYSEPRTLSVSWENSTNRALTQETTFSKLHTTEYVSEYQLKDIPALKEEPYVDNIDNYRYLITYELMSVEFPKSGLEKYSTTWEEVVKTINKSDDFGDQLAKSKYFKEDLERIKAKTSGHNELANAIFSFVRDKMHWNEINRRYTKDGVQKAYKQNTGNVAEINLILVAMLRDVGIKANPVLVSTRSHGIPVFPTIEGFNYVIACANINGQEILMDATEKQAVPGVLPERALNWEGTMVFSDSKFKKVQLYPKNASKHNTLISVTIHDDGAVSGVQRSSYSDHEALEYRKKYKDINTDNHIEAVIQKYQFDDLTDFKVEHIKDLDQQIRESFEFEKDLSTSIVGDDIYFSPLFYLTLNENPFKLEERNYPVDFVYPFSQKNIVNIKLPDGYKVSSMPEAIRIKLPDGMGSFLFNISEVPGGINVMSNFNINWAVIPSYKYHELKEFFNQRVLKETEKVVLTKI